jgi:hypothetical protein
MSFCQTIAKRSVANLWEANRICDRCFRVEETWIGRFPMWLLSVADPLREARHFAHLKDCVILVDFEPELYADLGGTFALVALTTSILECPGYMVYTTEG